MSSAARWTVVVVVVVGGLVAALLMSLGRSGDEPGSSSRTPARDDVPGATAPGPAAPGAGNEAAAAARAAAGLPTCRPAAPAGRPGPASPGAPGGEGGTLAGSTIAGPRVTCMADGVEMPLQDVQSGTPVLLNLWAYWCAPCREELPALRDAQAELGDRARIVLAHVDANEESGLSLLTQLGVTQLPSVSDPQERLPLHFRAPPVLPISVFVRADGTVAKVLPQPLDSKEQVLDAVNTYLGVQVPA